MVDKTAIKLIQNQNLPLGQKTLMVYIVTNSGSEVDMFDLKNILSCGEAQVRELVVRMVKTGVLFLDKKTLKLPIDDKLFEITVSYGLPMRKAKSTHTIKTARERLGALRLGGFVGRDLRIHKLSLEYDKIMKEYSGKLGYSSLNMVPAVAKKSRNWGAFKKTLEIIEDRGFDAKIYLRAQFEAMGSKSTRKHFGLVYPYPNMLHSKWAIENYVRYIKENISHQTEKGLLMSDSEVIRHKLQSSHDIFRRAKKANPELSALQCLLLVCDDLNPLYLACSASYLKFLNSTDQELDDPLIRELTRMKIEPEYCETAKTIYKEITG